MKLRTFTAPDMPAAMDMVRDAMGDDAVIIASKEIINGKRSISVTAAVDGEQWPPKTRVTEKTPGTEDLRFSLRNILRFHNVPELFIAKSLQKMSETELENIIALHRIGNRQAHYLERMALEKMAYASYNFSPLALDSTPQRLMLIGTPGIGKTLTVAKMAAKMAMDKGPLAVCTTDNKRAGGIEQLKAFTDILGIELKLATTPEELRTILSNLPEDARILIDTAGCNPYHPAELSELKAYTRLNGIEPILVMPAGSDASEALDMAEIFATLPVKRFLVTQTDAARRFGSMLAVAAAQSLALCNMSHSASITEKLLPADPALLAQLLLKYQPAT